MYNYSGPGVVNTEFNFNGGDSNRESSRGFTANTLSAAASVPAPLPILGLPAVLLYARKLKARIMERKATAAVS
jgi:hypothetical protein